jgi:hypothetical protein
MDLWQGMPHALLSCLVMVEISSKGYVSKKQVIEFAGYCLRICTKSREHVGGLLFIFLVLKARFYAAGISRNWSRSLTVAFSGTHVVL